MTFEDKVMAYFDGMLDGKAEQKLLSEIQSDPQKQQIFEAHESLHGMMADRTNPIGVPLKAEQLLAAKIPALGTAIPQISVTDRGKAAV
ncbi:MAG: hypothetical protein CL946_13500, partial [Ectothiorhodospiraceae bacterium]|nr:hypothetical protein [Ectothiorhodospiraceae bacterium]